MSALSPSLVVADHGRPRAPAAGEGGYNLVILVVLITVMNVAIAAALPVWSTLVKREKEEEAIFRGMQYAEAIRVFQQRHGRLPISIEELVEREPRSLRKLYPNPLDDSGEWGLLVQTNAPQGASRRRQGGEGAQPGNDQQGAGRGRGQARQQREEQPRGGNRQALEPPSRGARAGERQGPGINPQLVGGATGRYTAIPPGEEDGGFGGPSRPTTGPIVGVYPAVDESSLRVFFGQDNYSSWHFTFALVPMPVVLGERGPPRVTSEWVGKPFREDLQPPGGQGPGAGSGPGQGRDLTPRDDRRRGARDRRRPLDGR